MKLIPIYTIVLFLLISCDHYRVGPIHVSQKDIDRTVEAIESLSDDDDDDDDDDYYKNNNEDSEKETYETVTYESESSCSCWKCDGNGYIYDEYYEEDVECPKCQGSGELYFTENYYVTLKLSVGYLCPTNNSKCFTSTTNIEGIHPFICINCGNFKENHIKISNPSSAISFKGNGAKIEHIENKKCTLCTVCDGYTGKYDGAYHDCVCKHAYGSHSYY